jgi:hypothetical protein
MPTELNPSDFKKSREGCAVQKQINDAISRALQNALFDRQAVFDSIWTTLCLLPALSILSC